MFDNLREDAASNPFTKREAKFQPAAGTQSVSGAHKFKAHFRHDSRSTICHCLHVLSGSLRHWRDGFACNGQDRVLRLRS